MSLPTPLIVVSYYAARPQHHLRSLLKELRELTPQILVAINDDRVRQPWKTAIDGVPAVALPNGGMNIGAWRGAHEIAERHDSYIFLQDECRILSADFVQAYCAALSNPRTGLVGEIVNPRWNRTWEEIENSSLNYDLDLSLYGESKRVAYYLSCIRRWGIDPGPTARHLQSLVWAATATTLDTIGKFPLGNSKEECIAAEIAVSRAVEQAGLQVTQIGELPFRHVHHIEWRFDGSGKQNPPKVAGSAAVDQDGCVFVIGMHRSGTSSLAGSLEERGLHLGEVDGWDRFNAKGNRENRRIMSLNEQLLAHNGFSWKRLPDRVEWQECHAQSRDAILHDLRSAGRPRWGMKDPRLLALLDFWLQSSLMVRPRCVATFRHPLAVAESLNRRSGMPLEEGAALWVAYNRRLLEWQSRLDMPLLCFDVEASQYEQDVDAVARGLGLSETPRSQAGVFFEEQLRSGIPPVPAGFNAEALRLYDTLRDLYESRQLRAAA